MMRSMRAMAKWMMVVMAITFVGWMVFDVGMDVTGRGQGGVGSEIARVNGTKINDQAFYAAVRNAQEQQRRSAGSAPITLEDQRALEDAVLENLIQGVLLQDELDRRGIRVSDEEIISAARTSPPPEVMQVPDFQTDGRFDLQKYQRYLAANSDPQFLQALEFRYREEIPRLKLFEEVAAGVYVPSTKLWRMYQDQHDTVTIQSVVLGLESVPDSAVRLDDDGLRRYYNEHREDFRRPDVAYLSYVMVDRQASPSDSAAAVQRADSVRRVVAAPGADFAAVARDVSADSVSAAQGGDLGEATRGQMVAEFERAALSLRPGQVSPVIRTQFGYHIIKLESKSGDKYRARHILIPVELAGAHRDQVEARADSLDRYGAEQTDPATLDSVAADLGVPVLTAPPLARGQRIQLGRYLVPDGGVWAFGTARAGETSHVVETDQAYYLFRLDSLHSAGVPPFERVKDVVRQQAEREARLRAARAMAEQVDREVRGSNRIRQIGARLGRPVVTLGPFTRVNPPLQLGSSVAAIGASFGLAVGQTSGPIESENGILFIEPVARKLADSTAFARQIEAQRAQVIQAARQARVREVIAALRENAKVIDRREEREEQARKLEEAQGQTPLTSGLQ